MNTFLDKCMENLKRAKDIKKSSPGRRITENRCCTLKEIEYNNIISDLNDKNGTEFYLEIGDNEVGPKSFRICGHREFGKISRYSGNLRYPDRPIYVGKREFDDSDTIRLIVDSIGNYIMINMKEFWKNSNLSYNGNGRPYKLWDINDIRRTESIIFEGR